MKTIICTIGNRDLQIPVNVNINDYKQFFTLNNDDNNYLIIKKSEYNLYEFTSVPLKMTVIEQVRNIINWDRC